MTPELRIEVGEQQFAPREVFNQRAGEFVDLLEQFESSQVTEEQIGDWLHEARGEFSSPERALFSSAWELFRRKHCLGGYSAEERDFLAQGGRAELVVELGGPLAVGKTTVARALAAEINAKLLTEIFAPGENPFLAPSYQNPDLMARTQWGFLLASLQDSFRARFCEGRLVRDNTHYSDALIFMPWRHQRGIMTGEEYNYYQRLYALLAPAIPRPNLLIMLYSDSPKSLINGWRLRLEGSGQERQMEAGINGQDFMALYQATNGAIANLRNQPGLRFLDLKIDPERIYRDAGLRYDALYRIREELGILGELIQPSPDKAAHQILDFFAFRHGKFFVLHGPSMFAGKTRTVKELFQATNGQMLIFRPDISKRWPDETDDLTRTRDGDLLPVVTLKTNSLEEAVRYVGQKRIVPAEKPILAVDEAMLLTANANQPEAVIRNINWFRQMGFNVLFTGLSTSYKGEPFNFMDVLIFWANEEMKKPEPSAAHLEITTRCRYCQERAAVSRLTSKGKLAPYDLKGTTFPGDAEYEPVCGTHHPSCADRPTPFVKNLLPKSQEEYQAILAQAGVII